MHNFIVLPFTPMDIINLLMIIVFGFLLTGFMSMWKQRNEAIEGDYMYYDETEEYEELL
jgi:hypothetical protein